MTVRVVEGAFKLLGSGASLPGYPVPTLQGVKLLQERFGLKKWQPALDVAKQMGITSRHPCRNFLV